MKKSPNDLQPTEKAPEVVSTIFQHLNRIQGHLKAPKGQHNSFGNYNYRSCEDIVEAVKPLLGECHLILSDEIVQLGDRYYVKATAVLSNGTEVVQASAYAREPLMKKGMDEAQVTGATSSYARKYALNGLFAIDDTKDADTMDNREPEKTVQQMEMEESLSESEKRVCEVCGAEAYEKKGMTKGGKPYHGIFCTTQEKSHTRWLWN